MTIDFIQNNIQYDLKIGSTNYHGNIDYVTEHLADVTNNNEPEMIISDNQPKELKKFAAAYKMALKTNSNLSIEEFHSTYEG